MEEGIFLSILLTITPFKYQLQSLEPLSVIIRENIRSLLNQGIRCYREAVDFELYSSI